MNISRQNFDDLTAKINIQIGREDYEERVNNVLKDYRKKAVIPGFRPGKTPISVIQKLYGKSALLDELNKILGESLENYIKSENIQIIGDPLPVANGKQIDIENDSNFEFTFEIGLQPEIKIEWPKKEKLELFEIEVTDQDIDNEISYFAKRFGTYQQLDEVNDQSILTGNIKQIDDNNQPIENGLALEKIFLNLNQQNDEEQKKIFIGAKVGDSVNFNIKKWYNYDQQALAKNLYLKQDEIENIPEQLQFTIQNIEVFQPSEINEEIYKKVFPNIAINTIEEFRDKIKDELRADYLFQSNSKNISQLKEYLLNTQKINLPEDFIKRYFEKRNEEVNNDNKIDVEKELPKILKSFKWQIIKNYFVKEFNIKVEENDLKEYARKMLKYQFKYYYGFVITNDEEIDQYVTSTLKSETDFNRILNEIIDIRMLEIAKTNAKSKIENVTIKEFYEKTSTK